MRTSDAHAYGTFPESRGAADDHARSDAAADLRVEADGRRVRVKKTSEIKPRVGGDRPQDQQTRRKRSTSAPDSTACSGASAAIMMDKGTAGSVGEREPCTKSPRFHPESASTPLWRKLFFCFFDELLKTPEKIFDPDSGVRWKLKDRYKSEFVSEELREQYVRQGKSLGRAFVEMEFKQLLICGGISFCRVLVVACIPWILLTSMTQVVGEASYTMGTIWAKLFLLYVCFALEEMCSVQEMFQGEKTMLRVVSSLQALVFESAVASFEPVSLEKERIADIVHLFDDDGVTIGFALANIHRLWSRAAMVSVELYVLLQVSQLTFTLVSATIVAISIALSLTVVAAAYLAHRSAAKHNDILNIIHECFKSIRMVKLNAWETKMQEKIEKECAEETQVRRMRAIVLTVIGALYDNSSQLFAIVMFSAMAADGKTFSPASVFTVLILFERVKLRVSMIAQSSSVYLEAAAVLKKVDTFLREHLTKQRDGASSSGNSSCSKPSEPETAIAIENGCFTHGAGKAALLLANVNVSIQRGQLVAVHGKSGSGKSTLLRSMIQEVKPANGEVFVKGDCKIAYCAQEPWLQTLSIRDNILFGSEYDEPKYLCVLDACCLLQDLKMLPSGDQTQVGPRGVNLSGGQKSRIALARACYSDADIFLLDCPFATVDPIIQNDIFRKCVLELLQFKTIVFVSHNAEVVQSRLVDQALEIKDMSVTVSKSREVVSRRVSEMVCAAPWKQQNLTASRNEREIGGLSLWTLGAKSSTYLRYLREKAIVKNARAVPCDMELISYDTLREFFCHRRTLWVLALALAAVVCGNVLLTAKDLWLVTWSSGRSSYSSRDSAIVYGSLIVASVACQVVSGVLSSAAFRGASNRFSRRMTRALLDVPMTFFYSTPLGELMYRYFIDMAVIDGPASAVCLHMVKNAASLCCRVGVIGYFMGAAGVAAGLIAVFILTAAVPYRVYVRLRQADLANQWRNLNYISEALDGASTIRAFGPAAVDRFRRESGIRHDTATESSYFGRSFNSFVLIRANAMFGVQLVLLGLVLSTQTLPPAALGLLLYYIVMIENDLVSCTSGFLMGQLFLLNASRIRAYGQLETEGGLLAITIQAPSGWPSKGEVVFDHVSFGYSSDPSVGVALQDVSCTVTGGQRIGVVGRTGSGKSSIAMALFRLHPTARGHILIDGVDTRFLDLKTLRSSLTIIPEMPMFYRCSVRHYLDPFDEFGDGALWSAIHKCGLQTNVASLEQQLLDNGENWSVGERQILCMVRALLKPSRILILDEALSALDQENEAKLLAALESSFAQSTVFLISHRLDQMLHFDKIMVLGEGRLLEFGSAVELAGNPNSAFYEFLETTLLSY
ncbi:Multidrug resistance-associated protein 1, partial [Globisporangium polare]